MRSYILVIFSAMLLGGLFVFVWMLQPATKTSAKEQSQVVPPAVHHEEGYGPIKPGELAWIKQYDRRGQLASRFAADQYLPQPDGTFRVTSPRAEFFLANHQRLQIQGIDGNVVMKDVPNLNVGGPAVGGPPAPPSRGRLNQVTVTLIDESKDVQLLKMTTNNVVFDNEAFRVFTEGYTDEHKKQIGDDEVPVHVTGNIKMEGRGLTIRWNDTGGRLELLEIAHGDWLEITDPSGFSPGGAKTSPIASSARRHRPLPEMLADAASDAGMQILTHHPPTSKPQENADSHAPRVTISPIYQASFFDNVRITQADAEGKADQIRIDQVDRMDVDFLMKQSTGGATTQAAPAAPAATGPAPVATEPAAAAPAQAAQPTPKQPPIFIHWTGKLRITPTEAPPAVPLQPGDSLVVLIGQPVNVHRAESKGQGTEDVQCATVWYATAGERVWLKKSEACPQIHVVKSPPAGAKDQRPTLLDSRGMVQYSRIDSRAVLSGPGKASVPLEPDPRTAHPQLDAAWVRQAVFEFTPETAGGQSSVKFGRLEGAVDIRHPKLALESESLDLLFEPDTRPIEANATTRPSSSQPNLRQMIATTAVYCQVEGGDGKKQNIRSDRLVLDTDKADGKLYARHINATGRVHAYGEDDLKAGTVDLLLNPARKKAAVASKGKNDDETAQVELEKMVAHDNVIAHSKDGSTATGDDLVVTGGNGRQHTVLTSRTNAIVTDVKGNVVRGREIQFDSADGRAHVIGPGTMHAIQQASTTQPAQPVDVKWANEAVFDGAANHVDVDGSVVATSTDKKGFIDVATGRHMHIDLRAKPTTQPVSEAALASAGEDATALPAPAPRDGNLKMDPFKGKEVSAMTIQDDAKLTSTLRDSEGNILQQFELEGPRIIVNEFGPAGTAARTIEVPAAGKMLARDHRPKAQQQQPAAGDDASGARGATAFEWKNQLLYREAEHRADMTGQVVVVHQDDEPDAPVVRMTCDRVTSWFEPAPKRAASDQKAAEDSPQMQLRYLSADGDPVVITREASQVLARHVDFIPKKHLLIASGTRQNPVRFTDGTAASGVAERVEWATDTWRIQAHNAIFDDRPSGPGVQSAPPKKQPQAPLPNSTPPLGSKR
jgi:hypothetical protein